MTGECVSIFNSEHGVRLPTKWLEKEQGLLPCTIVASTLLERIWVHLRKVAFDRNLKSQIGNQVEIKTVYTGLKQKYRLTRSMSLRCSESTPQHIKVPLQRDKRSL